MNEILIPMGIVGLIGAILGLVLAVASQVFYVMEDHRLAQVAELLPGYNCGACGYPGCSGLAEALVNKEAKSVKLCKPSNQEQRNAIVDYLGNTAGPGGDTIQVVG